MEEIDSEKEEYISHVQTLEREISSLSASSLVREKEALRKDLEKTKMKLKDTEFKLRSAMQEKTKLEVKYCISCFPLAIYSIPFTIFN